MNLVAKEDARRRVSGHHTGGPEAHIAWLGSRSRQALKHPPQENIRYAAPEKIPQGTPQGRLPQTKAAKAKQMIRVVAVLVIVGIVALIVQGIQS